MKVLGVCAGAARGSAEILLVEALTQAGDAGHDVAMLRLDDMRIPTGPFRSDAPDDGPWFLDQLMAADGVIYSAPIYSRSAPGKLRLLSDRVFGPHVDTGFTKLLLEREAAGEPVFVPFTPDTRALRTRPTAFIAVGGSLTPQWKTLALPLMHALTFSMGDPVVDQVVLSGAGTPQSIVLDDEALLRARQLGSHLVSQLGREAGDVDYLGDPGLCPLCHLSVVEVRGTAAECASCGALGRLEPRADGTFAFVCDAAGLAHSVIADAEKMAHGLEVLETGARHHDLAEEIAQRAAPYAERIAVLTPSTAVSPAGHGA